jgi:hypothetical protein
MTCIDPAGVLGAKRATWRSVNPRELLQTEKQRARPSFSLRVRLAR